jgi:general stress protein 26
MSKTNLYNQEAIDKIKDMAESIDFCMFATRLGQKPFHVIPMSTKKVDLNGHVWFLSGKDSDHNKNIHKDNSVQVMYSKPGDMSFMTIHGTASINTEKSILKELYGSSDDNWFDGLDDPNLTAIQVKPLEAHYWEPKHNKLVTLFKMGVGAVSGEQPDISEHGDIKA